MHRNNVMLLSAAIAAFTVSGCAPFRQPYAAPEYRDPIVAIDVALEADRTPPDPSTAVKPHITLLQGFVKTANIHAFSANVAMVMATTNLERLTVKPISGSGQAAGAVDASPELRRLQERLTEAFSAYAVDPSDDTSIIVTPDGSAISGDAIHAVLHFVPNASGVNYRPHVVAGANQQPPAGFKPMGAAVYQLDRAGLATKTLWTWTGESGAR